MSSANINSDNVGDSVYVRTYKPSEPVDEDLSSSYLFKDNPDLLLKSLAESLYAFDLTMSRYTPTNNSLAQRRVNLEESQALRQNINIEGRIEALKEYYFKTLDSASIDSEIRKGVKKCIEVFLDDANENNFAAKLKSINKLVENRIVAFTLLATPLAESIIKIPVPAPVSKPSVTSVATATLGAFNAAPNKKSITSIPSIQPQTAIPSQTSLQPKVAINPIKYAEPLESPPDIESTWDSYNP